MNPKKTKFKKYHAIFKRTKETKNLSLSKGNFGVKAIQNRTLTAVQLESIKKNLFKKGGKNIRIWLNVFPHLPKTKKPLESRMGKGKGAINNWYFFVKTGKIVFEFDNYNRLFISQIRTSSLKKLSFKTKLVFKNVYENKSFL